MRGVNTQLLIDEPPLQVLPSLAARVGLNEAIVLQQLHYWLGKSKNERDGRLWVYNSIEDWREQFPFWSASTIRRTFASLERKGMLKGNYSRVGRTVFYTPEHLKAILELFSCVPCNKMAKKGKK